jgi:hypothetical protein
VPPTSMPIRMGKMLPQARIVRHRVVSSALGLAAEKA